MNRSAIERNEPSREQLRAHRQVFWDAWQKQLAGLPLNALEVRISRVIALHPEYHHLFGDLEQFLDRDFSMGGEASPYLHLSLHLALEEQLASRQPPEAGRTLEFLMQGRGLTRHDALHLILEILAETVYNAQRIGREPDVESYRQRLLAIMRP